MTPIERAQRVQELAKHATKEPWEYEFAWNNAGLPTGDLKCPGRNDGFTVELLEIDCKWITETRTLAPALAADVQALTEERDQARIVADDALNEVTIRVAQIDALTDLLREMLPKCQHFPGIAERARALGIEAKP